MPGFEWRMPMDISWYPKVMDFERQQEARKKASSTSWLKKYPPCLMCTPSAKYIEGLMGCQCGQTWKFPDDMFLRLFICGMSGKAREVLDVYVATRVFTKMPLPEPVAYFPSVLQKGHSIRHSVGIQGFGHEGGGQCCQQYRRQTLVIHFGTFGLFKKKGNKKGPVRKKYPNMNK